MLKIRSVKTVYLQILFVMFAFVLMVVSSYFFAKNIERRHLEEQTEDMFVNIESLLNAELQEFETMLGVVSETVRGMLMLGMSLEEVEGYIRSINIYGHETAKLDGLMNVYAMFDIFGGVMFNPLYEEPGVEFRGDDNFDPATRAWYITAIEAEGATAVTDIYLDYTTNSVTFTYARALFDDDGKRIAIVCLDVLLDRLYKFSEGNRDSFQSIWTLHDKNHVIMTHPKKEFVGSPFREIKSDIALLADELEREGYISNRFSRDYTGSPVAFSMRPLENGWFLGVITYTDSYYSNINNFLFFFIALGLLLAAGLVLILIRINAAKEKSEKLALKAIAEKSTLAGLSNIMNGLDVIICVTDPNTYEVLFVNEHMKEHFGVDEGCLGKKCYKVFRNNDKKCDYCPCDTLNKDTEQVIVWEDYHPVTNRIYNSYSRFIDWPGGKKVHLEHSIDITKNKEAEREIAEKNEQLEIALHKAEAASKAKSAFLANMSHEIRTPMNAILGITEIQLRNEALSPETEEGLEKIYDSGTMLLNIINDILDLSKIEAGKLEIVPIKYDLPSLINDAIQLCRIRCDTDLIKFILEVDENMPFNMFGDELRLKQILNNILSNAFKYTDKGEVRMSIYPEPIIDGQLWDEDEDVMIVFKVSDTGQGMTQEQQNLLFDEYTRFNMEANRTTIGTGLGMSITKHLVELMKGEISVESEVDKGSVFTVRIPQKRLNDLVCGKDMAEKLRSFRFQSASVNKKNRMLREYMPYGNILIVDDVETNLYVTRGMLLPYGLNVDTASSGFEAIEKIKAGKKYDVIFMDHMMPKMDGIEATRRIRAWENEKREKRKEKKEESEVSELSGVSASRDNEQQSPVTSSQSPVPIIALTANALVGQAEIFLENGFDGYISKPIDSRELNQVLNEFIRNKTHPEIVKAARRERREQAQLRSETNNGEPENKEGINKQAYGFAASLEVKKFFVLDAESAVAVLEGVCSRMEKDGNRVSLSSGGLSESDINSCEIALHGIKSALANIGETELSDIAFRLEKAAMEKNLAVIGKETPAFIDALKALIKKYTLETETNKENKAGKVKEVCPVSGEDASLLYEKLLELKTACEAADSNAAGKAMDEIKQKEWPLQIDDKIDEINVHLLHSSFKKMLLSLENIFDMYEWSR